MASIRKHRKKWQVQVRRLGQPALSRSFVTRADAQRWARQTEMSIERAELQGDLGLLRRVTLADLLRRYRDEISPSKRSVEPPVQAPGSNLAEIQPGRLRISATTRRPHAAGFTSIFWTEGCGFGAFGSLTDSTPLAKAAAIFSLSTLLGTRKDRTNEP